ncbi:hypothetical protein M9H77_10795 [Catharanthus roseus]|uniref:Uncharacterized protein n=1 Tax=Catharanthus roseus TaxID=4058 RepID=A0ACC0BCT3_CATRO|nr:hypothetical protein M9H77_10795 [Catharanthus roseus]
MFREDFNRVNNNVVKEKSDEELFEVREVEIQPQQVDEPKVVGDKYQTVACDRGRKSAGNKYSKRIECLTCISVILRDNSMWEVSKFVEEHNYELYPSMLRFMLAHRMIHSNFQKEIKRMLYFYTQNNDTGEEEGNAYERNVLRRWRKDVIRRHTRIFFDEGYPYMSMDFKKYKEFEKIFNEIVNLTLSNEARILKFKQLLESNKVESSESEGRVVLNPNVVVPRGRPRSNHLRASNESGRRNRRHVDNSCRHASNAFFLKVHLKMVQHLKATEQMYQQQFK